MKVLIACDKFKGSLSSADVAEHLGRGLADRGIAYRALPLADGGDGSVAAAIHAGFRSVTVTVAGPTGIPHAAELAFDGTTCILEAANTCGLALLPDGLPAPLDASSLGLGEAIRAALELGARRLVLALGGSASTDAGAGMLCALGMRFLDVDGRPIDPCGAGLAGVRAVVRDDLCDLTDVELVIASDVENPLTGPTGAAAVYGPQKGATASDVATLEDGLSNVVRRIRSAGYEQAVEWSLTAGAGSAGGLGFAALLLGGRIASGAEFFLDLLDFDSHLTDCDLVITGEGHLDTQTRQGKLPSVVARRSAGVPVIAVVGRSEITRADLNALGITAVHALSDLTDADTAGDPALSARLLYELGRSMSLS